MICGDARCLSSGTWMSQQSRNPTPKRRIDGTCTLPSLTTKLIMATCLFLPLSARSVPLDTRLERLQDLSRILEFPWMLSFQLLHYCVTVAAVTLLLSEKHMPRYMHEEIQLSSELVSFVFHVYRLSGGPSRSCRPAARPSIHSCSASKLTQVWGWGTLIPGFTLLCPVHLSVNTLTSAKHIAS